MKGLKFQVWNRSLTQQICNYGYCFLTIALQIPEQDLSCKLFKLIFAYEESKRKSSFFRKKKKAREAELKKNEGAILKFVKNASAKETRG